MIGDSWITFLDDSFNFKTVTVSSSIAGPFMAYMIPRGFKSNQDRVESNVKFNTNLGPGMQITTFPTMKFTLGDKTLELKTRLVAETGKSLMEIGPKVLPSGDKYYMLYEEMRCLVLTEQEGKDLIPLLYDKVVEARKITESFMKKFHEAWGEGHPSIVSVPRPKDSA